MGNSTFFCLIGPIFADKETDFLSPGVFSGDAVIIGAVLWLRPLGRFGMDVKNLTGAAWASNFLGASNFLAFGFRVCYNYSRCSVDFRPVIALEYRACWLDSLLKGGVVFVTSIEQFRKQLAWSQRELARRARLDPDTVRKAEKGISVSGQSAAAIAEAFSDALGRQILPGNIEGLVYS